MIKSLPLLLVLLLLLGMTTAQQICLHRECADELKACDSDCAALMGKCTFSCTLSSLGCLEQCLRDHQPATDLLLCSFTKCINV